VGCQQDNIGRLSCELLFSGKKVGCQQDNIGRLS